MTNSSAALRLLVVYAIIIPAAILMGYMLTNPLDYGTVGFVGILLVLLASPILIKWHYPIVIFCLSFPALMFFLPGSPNISEIAVIIGFCIAVVERTMSKEHQFLSAPVMTIPLVFTAAMVVVTMQLTGGFHLHAVGGGMGGGRKYISLYLGIATFFVLISRGIPSKQRRLYLILFFLPGIFSFIGDLYPYVPSAFRYIFLLFKPSLSIVEASEVGGIFRFAGVGHAATAAVLYMLARYGLRNILSSNHLFRLVLFAAFFVMSQLGGFRSVLFANVVIIGFVFFLEGLHRTRWMLIALLMVALGAGITLPFVRDLPDSIQRSMAFLPINIDPAVRADAEWSTDWRLAIWRAILPKVPDYLLLGKGYSLTEMDYENIGPDSPFRASARANASLESLAVSNDFHSGPLSTVICFGIWGAFSILAIMVASLFIVYRNYRYGDPALRTVNTLLLAMVMEHTIHFFLIFGAYQDDVGWFARYVGFSVALNWGVCGLKAKTTPVPASTPMPLREPKGLPHPA